MTKKYIMRVLVFIFVFTNNVGAYGANSQEPKLKNGQAKYFNLPQEVIEALTQRYSSQNANQKDQESVQILTEVLKGMDQNKINDLAFPVLRDGTLDVNAFTAQIPQMIQSASQNLNQEQISRLRDPQFVETIKVQLVQGVTRALEERGFSIDPNTGRLSLNLDGMQINGLKFSLSPDGKYIIIDNFKITRGETIVTADRVLIERSQIKKNGQVGSLDAVNLKVQNNTNTVNFGWSKLAVGRDNQSKVTSLAITSSQLNVSENGQAKFATKKGDTGLEAVHTTVELSPAKNIKLSVNSDLGFNYNRNTSNPQSDMRIESMGGSLFSAEMNLNSASPNTTYKFQTESELKVYDPTRGQNLFLTGSSEVNAIENSSSTNNQVSSVNYVIEADQLQIDRYTKNEKTVVQGLSGQIEDNKIGNYTQGSLTADSVYRTRADRNYQVTNATYTFTKDSTAKVEHLRSDKAIYVSDKGSITIEGNVQAQQNTNFQTGETSSYISGDKVTYYKDNKWTSVFNQVEITTQKSSDKSERMFISAGNGAINSSTEQVRFTGQTLFLKETSTVDQTTKYSLINNSILSAEQNKDGSKRLFSLSQVDIQSIESRANGGKTTQFSLKGNDLYFEDQAKTQAINAKSISIVSNKTTDSQGETKEAYAVELGEALLKDLNKGENDYVLTSSTVLYERSTVNKEQKGSVLVKDLTGEIDGYKLTFKINKPDDALAGKTIDVYFNKNKELEYYSVKNEHGIIAAEKDGKKIVWTGGSIDVYKDGQVKIANITGTEMLVSNDKISGQIKIGQATATEQGSKNSLQSQNVSVEGKSSEGEMGAIQFGDLEILKDSGVQNLTASKFSAMLSKLDSKTNQSVAINADGIEAARVEGLSQGLIIRNGDISGADLLKGQDINLSFSQFSGSENLADKSKGINLEQARIKFSETLTTKKLSGEMTIGKIVGLTNPEKGTSIVEFSDMKLLVVDSSKNMTLSGQIGWGQKYRDDEINYVELKDLNQIKIEDTAKARSLLFNGKRMAIYKNANGSEVLIVEQAQIQLKDPKATVQADVRALEYFKNNATDLKIIKEADLNGSVTYDGSKTNFQLNAKNIRFVNESQTSGQTKVRYFGIVPTASDSHVELKIDHDPISIEIRGRSASVQLITDKSMGRYTFIGQAQGGDKFKIKAGPIEMNGTQQGKDSVVLMNMTAYGTQHSLLLDQVAGLTNDMPITKNLSYNLEGFLKFQAWITKSTAIKVSYGGNFLNQINPQPYDNKANSLILSVIRKSKSETRYGLDLGLLGASAMEMTANDRCAMKMYGQCLGQRMLIPMTAYVGVNRCKETNGRTFCANVGGTYDMTTSMIKNASADAPGRSQGRTAGGANLVFGASFVSKSGVTNTLSVTAGELNGFLYKLYVPLR